MKRIWASRATAEDAKKVQELLDGTAENLLDVAIFRYPTLQVLKAGAEGEIDVVAPSQQMLVLESLGINPNAKAGEVAVSLRQLIQAFRLIAEGLGIRELGFVCREPRTIEIAVHHGFEPMTVQQCSCGKRVEGTHFLRMRLDESSHKSRP